MTKDSGSPATPTQDDVDALVKAAVKYFALEAEPYSIRRSADRIHYEQSVAMASLRAAIAPFQKG